MIKLFLLSILFPALTHAASTEQINRATVFTGGIVAKNYVKNPNCNFDILNIISSTGLGVSQTTGTNGQQFCRWNPGATSATLDIAVAAVDNPLGNSNCAATIWQQGSGSSGVMTVQLFNGSTAVSSLYNMSATASSWAAPFVVPVACNSGVTKIRITEPGAGSTPALEFKSNYGLNNVFQLNPNSDPVAYTPIFTGMGTVTNINCTWARDGAYLLDDCTFTIGTPTATEGRVSFPNGLVSSSTLPTLSIAGFAQRNQTNNAEYHVVLKEPSVSYFTFGVQSGGTTGLTKQNGSTFLTSSQTFSFSAKVRIAGWSAQNAISAQTSLQSWIGTTSYSTATTTSASLAGVTVTGAAVNMVNSNNMTITATGSGIGVAWAPTSIGLYHVCMTATASDASASDSAFNLIDEGAIVVSAKQTLTLSAGGKASITLCGEKYVNSISTTANVILQALTGVGTLGLGTNPVSWSIFQVTQGFPSPVLTGNVVQPDPQAPMMKTFEMDYYTTARGTVCSGSPCGTTSTYSGASITRASTGVYDVIVPSGVCTLPLRCAVTNSGNNITFLGAVATSTDFNFRTENLSSSLTDTWGVVRCGCQ